jgi:RHS repeat-associated protein
LQENHYYPFGLEMEGTWVAQTGTENAYQYNGKELNEDFGLNLHDYGARWYDGALGRWWSVDPLGEKTPRWSPYHYGFNNPLRFVDPTGMLNEAYGGLSGLAAEQRAEEQERMQRAQRAQSQSGSSTFGPEGSMHLEAADAQNWFAGQQRAGEKSGISGKQKIKETGKNEKSSDIVQLIIWPGDDNNLGHTAIRINDTYYGYYPTDMNDDGVYDKSDLDHSPGEMHIHSSQKFIDEYEGQEVYIADINVESLNIRNLESSLKWVAANPGFYELTGSNCTSVAVQCLQKGGLYIQDFLGRTLSGYSTYPSQLLMALPAPHNRWNFNSISRQVIGSLVLEKP